MPNYKCQFVFVALFLFVLLQKAKAIRCYTCSSLTTSECRDPFDVQQFTLQNECDPYQVCVKHKTHESYITSEELKRGCGSEDYCTFEAHSEYCTTCTWDLCNSSHKITSTFAIFAFILACNRLL